MKIGYKLYFMSEKLRKMQLCIQCLFSFFLFFSYHPILGDQSFIYAKYYSYVAQPRQIGRRTPRFLISFLTQKSLGSFRSRMFA